MFYLSRFIKQKFGKTLIDYILNEVEKQGFWSDDVENAGIRNTN